MMHDALLHFDKMLQSVIKSWMLHLDSVVCVAKVASSGIYQLQILVSLSHCYHNKSLERKTK